MAESIRILIVEDMPTDAVLAEREIRKTLENCDFRRVETRDDYLAALTEFQPDLIVSDYSMPRFDGLTALKLALEHTPSTPLIILTGSMNEDTAVGCMKAGAVDYVIKEYIKRLGQSVVHALEQKHIRLERQRAERALRESEEMYRSLVATSPTPIAVADLQGRIQMVNQPSLEAFGYTDDSKVLGQSIFDWVPPDESAQVRREIDELVSRGTLKQVNHALLRQTGTRFSAEINAAVVVNAANQPQHLMFMITDITERLQAEQSLRESEARYRTRTNELEALFSLSTHVSEAKTVRRCCP